MTSVKRFFKSVSPAFLGELLFLEVFFCYVVPMIGFFIGIPVGWYSLPVALLCSWLVSFCLHKAAAGKVEVLISSLLCWAFAIVFSVPLIDRSYDGQSYHQEIVAALCSGWIPLDEGSWGGLPLKLWSLHYAKALETAAACVVSFTGLMESGKCVNPILGVSVGCILYGFLSRRLPHVGRAWKLGVVAVALSCPVFITQALTYYIDFAKYFFTLLAILYLLEVGSHKYEWHGLAMLSCIVVFAAGTKFNAFFEIGVTVVACIAWLVVAGRMRDAFRIACVAGLAAGVGAVVIGWHPYMTNLISAGNPLYPLMGEGSVDIMTYNTPPEYLHCDRLSNFFRSLLSVGIPTIDTRKGGFGCLMPVMLLVALYSVWRLRKKSGYVPLYICACILISCFFFEQSWWARYITQLWLIPVLGIALAVGYGNGLPLMRTCAWTILICAVLTGLVSLAGSVAGAIKHTLYRSAVEHDLKGTTVRVSRLNEAHRLHLLEAGIRAISADSIQDGDCLVPYYGVVADTVHYPMLLLDSVTYKSVRIKVDAIPVCDYSIVFEEGRDDTDE